MLVIYNNSFSINSSRILREREEGEKESAGGDIEERWGARERGGKGGGVRGRRRGGRALFPGNIRCVCVCVCVCGRENSC